MSKILITGVSGLIGYAIAKELSYSGYEIFGTYYTRTINADYPLMKLDIRDYNSVKRVLRKVRPEIIIHSAAIASSDYCENNISTCWETNYLGTRNIAIASKGISKLIYISTAYVFDGTKGMYKEEDIPNPINYYGLTKLLGEATVSSTQDNNLVLRLSLVVGPSPHKKDLLKTLIIASKNKKILKVPSDQYLSPLTSLQVAKAIKILIEKDVSGLFHLGGERMSRYEFAKLIARILGNPRIVIGVPLDQFDKWSAKRPKDTSLDTTKIRSFIPTYLLSTEYTERILRSIIKENYFQK